jgi:hypothetical protein
VYGVVVREAQLFDLCVHEADKRLRAAAAMRLLFAVLRGMLHDIFSAAGE